MSPQSRSLRRYPVARGPEAQADSTAAGRSSAYGNAAAHFGPRSLPLFYTALERPPDRLIWEIEAAGEPCRVVLGCCEADGTTVPMTVGGLPAGVASSWPLKGLAMRPGGVYAWRVEIEEGKGKREKGKEEALVLEGRFWILDAGKAARLRQGRQILAQGTEPEFGPIAQALMLAELGLYQEALRQIQSDLSGRVRPARALLGHIAQALVYRQMAQQLEREAGQVPARFYVWARNREAYHQQQADARSETGSGTASSVAARLLNLL